KIYIVPIEGAARDRLMKKYPCYSKGLIPKEVYGTANDTETATVMNIMLVSDKLSDEIVYDIMDGINKNVATIQAAHKTANANIKPDLYLRAKPIPFHPGAVKWYKDHGFKF
ncbi:MAG: C4-dicarboxylate ABC transporter substrate-binding protein, partial [Acidaminococcaceae bacterium]|nr:C4-dicarboxylate ABC transporter substrate-binding protein [Acidaminococcaceae bacterium]